jgi:pyruvate dehydrogenase (quinone)
MCSLSGGLALIGAAVPYAIAAKFAHPDRPVIALVGDGAMQMNNMAELITAAKYWRQWTNPTLIICIFNNDHPAWRPERRPHAARCDETGAAIDPAG